MTSPASTDGSGSPEGLGAGRLIRLGIYGLAAIACLVSAQADWGAARATWREVALDEAALRQRAAEAWGELYGTALVAVTEL